MIDDVIETPQRKTYPQNWPAYNAAQTSEKDNFKSLLADLCANVVQPDYIFGRPGLPLADMVYAGATQGLLRLLGPAGPLRCPGGPRAGLPRLRRRHFNSVNRYIANPELTSRHHGPDFSGARHP